MIRSPFTGRIDLFAMAIVSFIAIVAILVFGVGAVAVYSTFKVRDPAFRSNVRTLAEADARTWIHDMHSEWGEAHVDCQGIDTDGNGYVSCSVAVAGRDVDPLECGGVDPIMGRVVTGCRVLRFSIMTK